MSKEQHLNALDVGRGLAIVSVLYGHALAPWVMNAGERFSEAAFLQWKFGASFMMPFFFFLSGLSWREGKSFSHTSRQSLALVFIALIASAAYDFARLGASLTGLGALLGGEPMGVGDYLSNLARMVLIGDYYSLSPLWFIVTLAIVRMLAAAAVRMTPRAAIAFVLLAVVLSLAAFDLGWRNFYQLKPLGVALAFFMAGHAFRRDFHAIERKPASPYALTLTGAAVVLATFSFNEGCRWDVFSQCRADWLNGHFGVALIHGQTGNVPLFIVTALAGVGFACGLAILLARYAGAIGQALDAWGGNSLNLLIVNSAFLHVGNVLVDHWIAPHVRADNIMFFATLLGVTLLLNLVVAHVLERPLRWLHRIALNSAGQTVAVLASAPSALTWAMGSHGVSRRNE